jgi:hypothetical protein
MRAASFKSLYQKRPLRKQSFAHFCVQGAPDTALGRLRTDLKTYGKHGYSGFTGANHS